MSEAKTLTNSIIKALLTDGMVFRRVITSGDMNDIKQPGIYLIDHSATVENLPISYPQVIVKVSSDTSLRYVLQEVYTATYVLRRTYWWTTWSGWRKYPG